MCSSSSWCWLPSLCREETIMSFGPAAHAILSIAWGTSQLAYLSIPLLGWDFLCPGFCSSQKRVWGVWKPTAPEQESYIPSSGRLALCISFPKILPSNIWPTADSWWGCFQPRGDRFLSGKRNESSSVDMNCTLPEAGVLFSSRSLLKIHLL